VELNAGEPLQLVCAARIHPLLEPTASFHWAREGLEVPGSWLQGPAQLNIPYLLSEHGGQYTCHVRTMLGTAV
jgi:hypothetical protein